MPSVRRRSHSACFTALRITAPIAFIVACASPGDPGTLPGAEHAIGESEPVAAEPTHGTGEAEPGEAAHVDVDSTRGILLGTAALVEGTVIDIRTDYDAHSGPRTVIEIEPTVVHAGTIADGPVELRMFGGPAPDEAFHSTSETVHFVSGGQYLVFLKNRGWYWSPFNAVPLRVETLDDREVLVDDEGYPLTSLTPEGLGFGPERLFSLEPGESMVARKSVAVAARRGAGRALDKQRFLDLLAEAIQVEGVAPSGRVVSHPEHRDDWRRLPVEPHPGYVPGAAGPRRPETHAEPTSTDSTRPLNPILR